MILCGGLYYWLLGGMSAMGSDMPRPSRMNHLLMVPTMGKDVKVRILTTTERDALTWTTGNVIYNSTLAALQTYMGTFWATAGRNPMLDLGFDLVLDARYGITQSAGAVSKWVSSDVNAYEFVQATGGSQPTYTGGSAQWHGMPCLTFDGTADYLSIASVIPGGATGVVVLVGRNTSSAATDFFLASADEATHDHGAACGFNAANNYAANSWNVAGNAQAPYGASDWGTANAIALTWSNGTDNLFRVNGGETETASGTDSGRWFGSVENKDNTTIGCINNDYGPNSFWEGDICCIGVKNSANLTATELAYLEARLAADWGFLL